MTGFARGRTVTHESHEAPLDPAARGALGWRPMWFNTNVLHQPDVT